jgi:hypothetical protein
MNVSNRLTQITDFISDRLSPLLTKAKDSALWQRGSEWYEGLAPKWQKVALFSLIGFLALIFLIFPLSYYSSSVEKVTDFDDTRSSIKELMQIRRDSGKLNSLIRPLSGDMILAQAQSIVQSSGLQPDQTAQTTPFDNAQGAAPDSASGVPKTVLQKGAQIVLAGLNLKQVVEIATKIQNIPSAKIIALDIKATAKDSHFFDTMIKVVSFAMPEEVVPAGKAAPKGAKSAEKATGKPDKKDSN